MKRVFALVCTGVLFLSDQTLAQAVSSDIKTWSNESEASVVQVGGNATSESYSAKSTTKYQLDANAITAMGRYLQTRAGGTETAKQWDATLRLEREFGASWAVFIQQGAESNTYSGYLQRDNTDLAVKYNFFKTVESTLLSEAGVRSTKTISSNGEGVSYFNSGRLYVEYSAKVNESVSAKAWVEYLPNFKDSDAYLVNYEPSLSVMMSQIFSIKVAYLVKYHNKLAVAPYAIPNEKKEDTSFTTALVAKF